MQIKRLLLAIPLFFSSCHKGAERDETSPQFVIPTGSRLVLRQALTVPAFAAGVYLQGGQVLPENQLQRYHPHCRLEVRNPPKSMQHVRPDTFVVRRATKEIDYQESLQVYTTRLDLDSATQPDVVRLTCQQWASSSSAVHVTGREIREALGDAIYLELTAQGS